MAATCTLGPAPARPLPVAATPTFWPPPVLSRERAIAETLRVESRGGGAFDTGTGVAVGAHVVLTNEHLTRDRVTTAIRCERDALAVDRIEAATAGIDAAALVTTGPSLVPVALSPADPVSGEPVLLVGFPHGQLTLIEGRVEGTLNRTTGAVLRFSPEPDVGQSGSPLFDLQGRLVGLAFARETVGGQGLALPVSRLRSVLADFRARRVPVAADATGDPGSVTARSSLCG